MVMHTNSKLIRALGSRPHQLVTRGNCSGVSRWKQHFFREGFRVEFFLNSLFNEFAEGCGVICLLLKFDPHRIPWIHILVSINGIYGLATASGRGGGLKIVVGELLSQSHILSLPLQLLGPYIVVIAVTGVEVHQQFDRINSLDVIRVLLCRFIIKYHRLAVILSLGGSGLHKTTRAATQRHHRHKSSATCPQSSPFYIGSGSHCAAAVHPSPGV
mmetsp:Transcript_98004/g.158076  ORF Transcript_98004/g.158076 Transcript_98004/m.158076 type:complete len:215 (-) Transcript_98004:132-776(-)